MRFSDTIFAALSATTIFAVGVLPAAALESVVINAPGAENGLMKKLEGASLLNQALNEQEAARRAAAPKWYMPWRRAQTPPEPLASDEVMATARAEYRRMISVLYGEGYYGGVVSVRIDGREAADIPPLNPPANIRNAVVTVQPGPQFTFSEAGVRPLAPGTTLPDGYARGQIAQSGVIGNAASAATGAWRDAGHPKVDLSNESITANHARSTLASNLTLDPGPRLRFGPVRVKGNKRVRTDRIVTIAGIPQGEVYSPQEVNDAAQRLRRTNAFRSVSIREAEEPGPGDEIAMNIDVLEQKRRRLGVGVEFTTQEGARFNAYWMHRNLFGGAENLRFDLDIENIGTTEPDNGTDYSLSGAFVRPSTFHPDIDLILGATLEHTDDPGYTADLAELGGAFAWHYSDQLEFRAGLYYRASDVEDAFGHRQYQMLSFPFQIDWDTRDNEFDPTRGFYFAPELTPFAGISNMEPGAQFFLDARSYLGLGEERNTVLAGRLQFGSLVGPEIPDAPQDYLFFAGGGGSVRGQPFQSLGAGELDGQIFGGRSYVALSGEIRSYVAGNFGLVGFVDAGYVGAEEFYDDSGNWMSGAGIGFRYKTGFGPIRVDVATPVSGGPDDADAVQLYIGIGQAF